MNDRMYLVIIFLPFLIFYSRILVTNYVLPYFKKKALIALMNPRFDWPIIAERVELLKILFKRDIVQTYWARYRNFPWTMNKDLIYGEIDFLSFYTILEAAEPKAHDSFYDLGSGAGKAVFAAAVFFDLSKSCGIELVLPLIELAKSKLSKALAMNSSQSIERLKAIEFKYGNFLEGDFDDATIIYVAATCFSDLTWMHLIEKMAGLKSGTRVIVATRIIEDPRFELKYHEIKLMSWGLSPVRIYQVKRVEKI